MRIMQYNLNLWWNGLRSITQSAHRSGWCLSTMCEIDDTSVVMLLQTIYAILQARCGYMWGTSDAEGMCPSESPSPVQKIYK